MALGNNNDLPVRLYSKQFLEILQTVYANQAFFNDFTASGTIEALDGVKDNDAAFYVKTSDIAHVLGTYNTGANIAFGTGTSSSSRFGQMTEIIYSNIAVPYTGTWSFNEGMDRFTVNNDLSSAVADRLELNAKQRTNLFDRVVATAMSDVATTVPLASTTYDNILALFNTLSSNYTNLEVTGDKVAAVTPEIYNMIVDGPSNTTAKNALVSIADNNVVRFKGFEIREVPTSKMPAGTQLLTYVKGIGKAFTGISTVRTVEAIDFDGQMLQGAGRYGTYIPLDNAKAIFKVVVPTP